MRPLFTLLLFALLLCVPAIAFDHEPINGWKKGPMPAGTYWFGGVVLAKKTDAPPVGFYFADFRGDHVLIWGSGKPRRVEAKDIAYWNNSLRIPIVEAAPKGPQPQCCPCCTCKDCKCKPCACCRCKDCKCKAK